MRKFLTIIFLVLLSSCTVKQDIKIQSDNGGSVLVDLELNPVFVKYLEDLSETTGDSGKVEVFNVSEISDGIKNFKGVTTADVSVPENSRLSLRVNINDYNQVSSEQNVPFVDIKESGRVKYVKFHLGRDNYKALDSMLNIDGNPAISGLAPQIDNPYSNNEYFSLLDYVFSDYFQDGFNGKALLAKSFVMLNITADGKIIESDTGEFSGNVLKVKIPLIEFLTLNKPVEFSFKYSI